MNSRRVAVVFVNTPHTWINPAFGYYWLYIVGKFMNSRRVAVVFVN